MLRTADPQAPLAPGLPSVPSSAIEKTGGWSYNVRFEGGRPLIEDLQCYVQEHGHRMPVAAQIRWEDLVVEVGAQSCRLPLSEAYVLGHYVSRAGRIPANLGHPLWRLAALTDISFQVVYGYELVGGRVLPLTPGIVEGLGNNSATYPETSLVQAVWPTRQPKPPSM
jgi:hypothetical protein